MTPLKKLTVFGTLLFVFGAAQLTAALLVEETFDYANGSSISGKSGGSGFTGNWSFSRASGAAGTMTVGSNGVEFAGAKSVWATRAVSITDTAASSFYFSYTMISTASATITSSSVTDSVVFRTGDATKADVFATAMNYQADGLRIRSKLGTANSTTLPGAGASVIQANTVYNIVGKFTFNDGTGNAVLSVWVNPTSELSTPSFSQSWVSSATSITQILLQRGDNTVGEGIQTAFDDLRVGTDWASATTGVSPIPEPSTAAALFGVSALAMVGLKRRR